MVEFFFLERNDRQCFNVSTVQLRAGNIRKLPGVLSAQCFEVMSILSDLIFPQDTSEVS